MSKSPYKHSRETIVAAKAEGHDIIDRLAKRWGQPKKRTYDELAERMGCSEPMAHFQNRFTLKEVEQMVTILYDIERRRIERVEQKRRESRQERVATTPAVRKPPSKKVSARLRDTLPIAEQRRALAEMKARERQGVMLASVGEEKPGWLGDLIDGLTTKIKAGVDKHVRDSMFR